LRIRVFAWHKQRVDIARNVPAMALWLFCAVGSASGQLVLSSRPPEPSRIPKIDLPKLYHLEWETRPSAATLKENVEESALGPFVSTQTLVRSQTIWERSRTFGSGEATRRAHRKPTLADRAHASYEPIQNYEGRDRNLAIKEAAFRHLIGFRKLGFAKDATVQFVSVGDIAQDPPPDLVDRLNKLPEVQADKLRVVPVSHALQPVMEKILDRFSGEEGPVYRVSDVQILPDGNAEVIGSFCDGGHWVFSKVFTIKESSKGWEVVGERDFGVQ
jgi:hypothetical protein